MVYNIKNIDLDEYSQFINSNGILFQKVEWIRANGVEENFPIVVKNNDDICIAGTYIFIKYNNEKCIYFPRGPVFSDKCTLDNVREFTEYIEEIAKVNECKKIVLDCKYSLLQVNKYYSIEKSILEVGFKKSLFSKFWHYNWGVNIEELSADKYLSELKQKTRYNINYAKKKGLGVTIDNSDDSIKKFYKLLQVTAQRDGFKLKDYNSYYNLFKYFNNNINLFWVYKDNMLLSAAICIIVGNQSYYVYGASSNKCREYKPTYLMQYAMIEYSINKNCKTYNMGGVGILTSDGVIKMNKGLYEFKKKFGGFIQDSAYTYVLSLKN